MITKLHTFLKQRQEQHIEDGQQRLEKSFESLSKKITYLITHLSELRDKEKCELHLAHLVALLKLSGQKYEDYKEEMDVEEREVEALRLGKEWERNLSAWAKASLVAQGYDYLERPGRW